jgi:hypothetical protein
MEPPKEVRVNQASLWNRTVKQHNKAGPKRILHDFLRGIAHL